MKAPRQIIDVGVVRLDIILPKLLNLMPPSRHTESPIPLHESSPAPGALVVGERKVGADYKQVGSTADTQIQLLTPLF